MGIFQQYLDRHGSGDAANTICEFLGEDTLEQVVLNDGTDQRIIFIAANFRREVTATVLWLREHQIDARCIKVLPYKFGEDLFIDLQQVIPTPEAADYMIRMAEKDDEEKSAKGVQKQRHKLRLAFWTQALEHIGALGSQRFRSVSPSQDNWVGCGTGISSCPLSLVFSKTEARVEIVMQRPNAHENKWLFDQLYERREELEKECGLELTWDRKDSIKRSFIKISHPYDGFNEENWAEMIRWMGDTYEALEGAFSAPQAELNVRLKDGEAAV